MHFCSLDLPGFHHRPVMKGVGGKGGGGDGEFQLLVVMVINIPQESGPPVLACRHFLLDLTQFVQ